MQVVHRNIFLVILSWFYIYPDYRHIINDKILDMYVRNVSIKATTHIYKHETSITFSYSASSILLLHFLYSTICVILQINTTYWMSFVAFHFHNTDYAFVYLFTSLTLHFSYFVVIQTSALSSKYRLHCLCIISTIVY